MKRRVSSSKILHALLGLKHSLAAASCAMPTSLRRRVVLEQHADGPLYIRLLFAYCQVALAQHGIDQGTAMYQTAHVPQQRNYFLS